MSLSKPTLKLPRPTLVGLLPKIEQIGLGYVWQYEVLFMTDAYFAEAELISPFRHCIDLI
jgi:hypothetical protein